MRQPRGNEDRGEGSAGCPERPPGPPLRAVSVATESVREAARTVGIEPWVLNSVSNSLSVFLSRSEE